MDSITHGIHGGLLYALPVKFLLMLFSVSCPTLIWILFIWGLIEGSWPDTYPWFLWKFFGASRWDGYYDIYHHKVETTLWKYFPAFRLHVSIVDPPFHEGDGNWWPRMWKTCVIYWVVTLLLLSVLIFV